MEEAKAAAYYEELTRKGEGAARFKRGLGFSSSSSSSPLPQTFSSFVRATSPEKAQKQAQLEAIQAKLRRSHRSPSPPIRSSEPHLRNLDRERENDRNFRSDSNGRRNLDMRGSRSRSPSRSSSIRAWKKDRRREDDGLRHTTSEKRVDKLDYARNIEGYSEMTPAERVKAKMKFQLSQTAAKDPIMGMSKGWERFDFNKDAPLDDANDEFEGAEDDALLVKGICNTFRFSAVQAKQEEDIKAAHDKAMFGASALEISTHSETSEGNVEKCSNEDQDRSFLISDKVLALQRGGSWRDRAARFKSGCDG